MARIYLWSGSGVTEFAQSTLYTVGQRIVPKRTDSGTNNAVAKRYVWECTTGGTTAAAEPTWDASYTPDTSTEVSGGATFTCRNPGYSSGSTEDWTFATIYLAYANFATQAGDEIYVHKTTQDELNVDTTVAFAANVKIYVVDKDASNALAIMGTGGWIGNSTTNRALGISCPGKLYAYGLTLRVTGSDDILIGGGASSSDGGHMVLEETYFWGPGANQSIRIYGQDSNLFVQLINPTFRFGATTNSIVSAAKLEVIGGSISGAGSVPSTFLIGAGTDPGGAEVTFIGTDLSSVVGTLVGDYTTAAGVIKFINCRLGTAVTILGTQTHKSRAGVEVFLLDSAIGNSQGHFEHHSALGSTVRDTGLYFTGTPGSASWAITTTGEATLTGPYTSPWISKYNSTTGAATTPYLEIHRDGSSTKYKNNEVWLEFAAKVTSGFAIATNYSDRAAPLASGVNQDDGTDTWENDNATHWAGKLATTSSLTPQEAGHFQARVAVGAASITVRVDPNIRT